MAGGRTAPLSDRHGSHRHRGGWGKPGKGRGGAAHGQRFPLLRWPGRPDRGYAVNGPEPAPAHPDSDDAGNAHGP